MMLNHRMRISKVLIIGFIAFGFLWAVKSPAIGASLTFTIPPQGKLFAEIEPVDLTISGEPLATKEQCTKYLIKHNAFPLITITPKELVDVFYAEAELEGIRPDVAFAQAIHETGYFRYGGDVIPLQNNYSGLGTTGGGVQGAWFPTAQIGIRAQIQHLLAYSSTRQPKLAIVDPRYEIVRHSGNFGTAVTWTDLNGKWAVPGKTYGQMILAIHQKILREK